MRAYVEENFEKLVDAELAKYGPLTQLVPVEDLRNLLRNQKELLPTLYRLLEPAALEQLSPAIDGFLNMSVGILCLSEVNDSLLMWSHYTDSHRGFVVGFDSENSFFSHKRTDQDEFGFLRRVEYTPERPQVVLSDTSSGQWFQTKAEHWAYEREWRILRVLAEAGYRVDRLPFPICLFDYPPEAVREIIVGMRSDSSLLAEIESIAPTFPRAAVLTAREDAGYGLVIEHAT
ncbi:MAG: DUF2971 domain-containing protein [Pyrinomonadaceae bacterium]|nr:DUF2971 domain-containing protein [Pyrinomonadaceae bacterium]